MVAKQELSVNVPLMLNVSFLSSISKPKLISELNNLFTKLMKHKHGWVFNVPVDAQGLFLRDYHTVVKEPMDLGTVKTKLWNSLYNSPLEFAEDVRLTFNNAILYNPIGHDVHRMAKSMLSMFEEELVSIEVPTRGVEPLPNPKPSPPLNRILEDSVLLERAGSLITPVLPETVNTTTTTIEKRREEEDAPVDNRDLTLDEKQRLSEELLDMPCNKLEIVVQIVKKSNPKLSLQDDEIELDIDSLDIQTLWELYRFVTTGYKQSLSNKKEDQEFDSERDAESAHNIIQGSNNLVTGTETSRVTESGKAIRMSSPVRQKKKKAGGSSSSSSDTGSCSSDSDFESSS
ncbi:transcription factor GTE5, chloroplastic-like [Raphanus sativus]|uniref:Transcription factor GTE5, chloroplastic-like n=1 Tax=Raphanus sativus TaxID=3726 RepID=A0A6J0JM31_RAPSA|nr:transcription factor GTE5, chloroplastic-like [Raphanus sativus]